MKLSDIQALNLSKTEVNGYTLKVDKNLYGSPLGFALKDVIGIDSGGKLIKAQANNINTSNVLGIIIAEDLTFGTNGGWVLSLGSTFAIKQDLDLFTKGTIYYLSPTVAGGYTDIASTALGIVVRPLFIATDLNTSFQNTGLMLEALAIENSAPSSAQVSITTADLSSGVYVFNHNLQQQFLSVSVIDNTLSNKSIPSGAITFTDGNKVSINVSSIAGGAITGTWTLKVSK